jgi:hypothetical protein
LAPGFVATPVVQLAGALARSYRDSELGDIVAATRRCAEHARLAFRRGGARAVGLQLDFDFPTRRLSHLARVGAALGDVRPLSATLLPSWLLSRKTHGALREVVRAFDLVVPMVFDESSLSRLGLVLERCDALGVSYRVGLPSFAEIRRVDAAGRWVSFRPISDDDLSGSTSGWRVAKGPTKRFVRPGEEMHAVTSSQLRSWISRVHAHGSPSNRGTVIFRAPRGDDESLFAATSVESRLGVECVSRENEVDVTFATSRGAPVFNVAAELRAEGAGELLAPPPPPWAIEHRCAGAPCGPRRADTLVVRRAVLGETSSIRLSFERVPRAVTCALVTR